MTPSMTLQSIAASAILTWTGSALAHDGHGLLGSHWHHSDSLGFAMVAVLAAAAVWLSQKK